MGTAWKQQIANKNFLSPIGFKFVLAKYPKVAYLSQSANIPGIGVNTVEQPTMLGRPIPWDSHGLNYEPFNLNFLVAAFTIMSFSSNIFNAFGDKYSCHSIKNA